MLSWKTGFEIELMAPRGVTREDLARLVAGQHGGAVRRFFHQQAEPGAGPGARVFENLTPGFAALDADGAPVAMFVDDLTLQADCDKQAPPLPGWYRVVADDGRILRLVERRCDPSADIEDVLAPLAALFGTPLQMHGAMVRVVDDRGASVAICAPLPGERERPCEIVTPPLTHDHAGALGALLDTARDAGFTLPTEGATHIHFDAAPLQSATAIATLVDVLGRHGDALKRLVGANPNCVRLGRWPEALATLTRSDAFRAMDWPAARAALAEVGLSKFCDFNLLNIATENRAKHTFEVRILPSHLHAAPILAAAALFESVLRWCGAPRQTPASLGELIAALPLAGEDARLWGAKVGAL